MLKHQLFYYVIKEFITGNVRSTTDVLVKLRSFFVQKNQLNEVRGYWD